jgi:hypothetical protein
MKKVIASILVCGFAIAFLACGNNKAKEEAALKAKADSTRMADSIKSANDAAAAKAKMVEDSTKKADSVAAAATKKKK